MVRLLASDTCEPAVLEAARRKVGAEEGGEGGEGGEDAAGGSGGSGGGGGSRAALDAGVILQLAETMK